MTSSKWQKQELDLPETKSKNNVYLVSPVVSEAISGCKLLSNKDILSRFFYFYKISGKSIRESFKCIIEEVIPFWLKSRLPDRHKQHCISKVESIFYGWALQKHHTRRTDNQISKETNLNLNLLQLFDISHKNYEKFIKLPEDIALLRPERWEKGLYCRS